MHYVLGFQLVYSYTQIITQLFCMLRVKIQLFEEWCNFLQVLWTCLRTSETIQMILSFVGFFWIKLHVYTLGRIVWKQRTSSTAKAMVSSNVSSGLRVWKCSFFLCAWNNTSRILLYNYYRLLGVHYSRGGNNNLWLWKQLEQIHDQLMFPWLCAKLRNT